MLLPDATLVRYTEEYRTPAVVISTDEGSRVVTVAVGGSSDDFLVSLLPTRLHRGTVERYGGTDVVVQSIAHSGTKRSLLAVARPRAGQNFETSGVQPTGSHEAYAATRIFVVSTQLASGAFVENLTVPGHSATCLRVLNTKTKKTNNTDFALSPRVWSDNVLRRAYGYCVWVFLLAYALAMPCPVLTERMVLPGVQISPNIIEAFPVGDGQLPISLQPEPAKQTNKTKNSCTSNATFPLPWDVIPSSFVDGADVDILVTYSSDSVLPDVSAPPPALSIS
eukprot:2561653-Rhodomonas_salina.1